MCPLGFFCLGKPNGVSDLPLEVYKFICFENPAALGSTQIHQVFEEYESTSYDLASTGPAVKMVSKRPIAPVELNELSDDEDCDFDAEVLYDLGESLVQTTANMAKVAFIAQSPPVAPPTACKRH